MPGCSEEGASWKHQYDWSTSGEGGSQLFMKFGEWASWPGMGRRWPQTALVGLCGALHIKGRESKVVIQAMHRSRKTRPNITYFSLNVHRKIKEMAICPLLLGRNRAVILDVYMPNAKCVFSNFKSNKMLEKIHITCQYLHFSSYQMVSSET